jgi:hypothetical protein
MWRVPGLLIALVVMTALSGWWQPWASACCLPFYYPGSAALAGKPRRGGKKIFQKVIPLKKLFL